MWIYQRQQIKRESPRCSELIACKTSWTFPLAHLEVKVSDVFAVHEAHPLQDLLQEGNGLALRHVVLGGDEVEKLPAIDAEEME